MRSTSITANNENIGLKILTTDMKIDLNLTLNDIDEQLGGGIELAQERREVFDDFMSAVNPAAGYTIYDSVTVNNDNFTLNGRTFNCGDKVAAAMQGATKMAVFAVTVGNEVFSLEKGYNQRQDYIKAYWCDKLANIALAEVLKSLKENLGNVIGYYGLNITSHWGPGYCSWDLSEQQYLLPMSPAADLGITLSESMLMSPVKSMSGVMGIGHDVVYRESGCADCRLDKCAYRSMKWQI